MIVYVVIHDREREGDRLLGIGATLDAAKAIAGREAERHGFTMRATPWKWDMSESYSRYTGAQFQRIEPTEVEGAP